MLYLAVTMDDCSKGEWVYSMRYMDRIVRICVPDPIEAMSLAQQETLFSTLLQDSFDIMREKKFLQKPEDAATEYKDVVQPKEFESEDDEDDDDEYDEDEDPDVTPLADLINEMLSRIENLEIDANKKNKPK